MREIKPISEERKQEVLKAIKNHLAEFGAKNYRPLLDACCDVPERTVWRWISAVKNDPPSHDEIFAAHEALLARTTAAAVSEIPPPPPRIGAGEVTPPPPVTVATVGVKESFRKLDFAEEIRRLYADAEMLRAHAVKAATDAQTGEVTEKIRDASTFEKSIKARAGLIETSLKVLEELWNAQRAQQFYRIIVEEIGKNDLDTQKRILQRLRIVNERHGMTISSMEY